MSVDYEVAPVRVLRGTETTLDDMLANARTHPDAVGFSVRSGAAWTPITYGTFASAVDDLALGLIASGLAPGDRIALMSRNRYEWALCDYAAWTTGAVVVPIYNTSSAEQVEWMLSDSQAVAVVVESAEQAAMVDAIRPRPVALRHVWTINSDDLTVLVDGGRGIDEQVLTARRAQLDGSSLATIAYTSGTTGRPKGCRITHENLVSVCTNTTGAPGIPRIFNADSSTLLFLPLAHCLARAIHLSCVRARVRIGYTPDVAQLADDLATFRPTLLLAVPRVFEKLYSGAQHQAHGSGRLAALLFARAERAAIAWSEAVQVATPGIGLRLRHRAFDKLVYSRIRGALGGQVSWAVSGGAPLGARLGHFFRGVGVTVLEGYGLTETAAGGTLNLPGRQRIGSVGPPIPGGSVRIADDGEILLRGGFVFDGYWRNDAATAEVLGPDGWLSTGDFGTLVDDFLAITGRKKELIVTAGGKNVAPAVLEDRVRAHRLVAQCVVVGDRRPFITCLITLDPETLSDWKSEHGKTPDSGAETLRHDPELLRELQAAVDAANLAVSNAESIRRFAVLGGDLTEAGGELTPTMKVKRDVVLREYGDEIESLYT